MKHPVRLIPLLFILSGWAEPMPVATAAMMNASTPQPTQLASKDAELIANARRVDAANQQLLAEKQKNLLEIEELQTQVAVLRNDQSSEGIREGALAVVGGFVLGWLSGKNKRKGW